jgi:hypothetical protein
MKAFERRDHDGEGAKAYSAFVTYRELGPGRSVDKAYAVHAGHQMGTKRAPGRWKEWSRQYDWLARARAYDDFLERERRAAVTEYERSRAAKLEERRALLQERLLTLAERVADDVELMIMWPLEYHEVEREDEHGNPVSYSIYPARWDKGTIARLLEVVRKAVGEPGRTDAGDGNGSSLSEQEWGVFRQLQDDPELGALARRMLEAAGDDPGDESPESTG